MADDEKPFHNPFAGLKREGLPRGVTAPVPAQEKSGPPRAVVRYERKGHGGKEVTRIEQLGLNARHLEAWLDELKRALGCGGRVDGQTLVVQGDQRERLRAWLEKKGVRKVTVS